MRSRYINKTAKKAFLGHFFKMAEYAHQIRGWKLQIRIQRPKKHKVGQKIVVYPKFQVASFLATRRLD